MRKAFPLPERAAGCTPAQDRASGAALSPAGDVRSFHSRLCAVYGSAAAAAEAAVGHCVLGEERRVAVGSQGLPWLPGVSGRHHKRMWLAV